MRTGPLKHRAVGRSQPETAYGLVWELYFQFGSGTWVKNPVSADAQAPPAAANSPLTSWVDPQFQHLAYLAADGTVWELYFQFGSGTWVKNPVSADAQAVPAVANSPLTSWVDPRFQHLAYLSADGHVRELYFQFGTGRWVANDVSGDAQAVPGFG